MKVRINEVWNYRGESVELVIIETGPNPLRDVYAWVKANRPDLSLANTPDSHGFHAKEIV